MGNSSSKVSRRAGPALKGTAEHFSPAPETPSLTSAGGAKSALAHRAGLPLLLCCCLGCGEQVAVKDKPTQDEIRQLSAASDHSATPAAAPATAMTPSVRAGLEPLHRQWGIKETAVDALGRIGEGAVPTLITALTNPDPRVRAEAARALARMGAEGKDAVPALTARLNDPEEDVRQAAARALGQMGPAAAPAVPALVSLIESPDSKAPPAMPSATPAPRPSRVRATGYLDRGSHDPRPVPILSRAYTTYGTIP